MDLLVPEIKGLFHDRCCIKVFTRAHLAKAVDHMLRYLEIARTKVETIEGASREVSHRVDHDSGAGLNIVHRQI